MSNLDSRKVVIASAQFLAEVLVVYLHLETAANRQKSQSIEPHIARTHSFANADANKRPVLSSRAAIAISLSMEALIGSFGILAILAIHGLIEHFEERRHFERLKDLEDHQ